MNLPTNGKIFAIDDDLFSLQMTTDFLTSSGYTACGYLSASEAIRQVAALEPEMVLLDLNMEEMDGFEACRQLMKQPGMADLPVIFITGVDDVNSLTMGFQAGAVDYIIKPLRKPELLARIQTHLTISRLKRQLSQKNEELARQIEKRSQLVEQIARGKKEWETIFDSVTDMIFLTDDQYRVVRCNQAAAERLENLEDRASGMWQQILNRPIGELFYGDASLSSRLAQVKEVQFNLLPGWFDVSVYPVYEGNSRSRTVYIIKDITARKQMEEALVTSQKFASLGTLVAGIAHEINSPLQVLTGLTKSLAAQSAKGQLSEERLQHGLDMLYRNSWRVAEIVRALRIYAHRSEEQLEEQDLNAIVTDTLLLTEHQMESWSNVAIHTDLQKELPPFLCNRDQIAQVLINLLSNARDAMPTGGEIHIRTGYDPLQEQVTLEVSDTGSGMPEAILSKIFDPFFTTKPLGQGTGLGLSIIQGIVRSHHGEIKVTSQLKKGTRFSLVFPARYSCADQELSQIQPFLQGRYEADISST